MDPALPPLRLPEDTMRRLGYDAVDLIVDRLIRLNELPVARRWSRAELDRRLHEPIPPGPRDPFDVLRQVATDIMPACASVDHPRFFAYVPGPSNYMGAVADLLTAGMNVFAGHWLVGAGAAQVELVVLDWLRQLLGLPETAGGIFTSGGTQATQVAVHAARVDRLGDDPGGARIYLTNQTHAVISRGLRYLGFAPRQVRCLPTTGNATLDVDALAAAVSSDRADGIRPFCVIATAGTTSCGAVDPLEDIADVCAGYGIWMHVDAAYGAAAALTPDGRRILRGLDRADSVVVDPHKWWFQPYEAGCLLVRDADVLPQAYTLHSEVLTETRTGADPVNFYDYGPQLSRSFRALKMWMTMQTFGLGAMSAAVQHGITMAEQAERLIRQRPHWTIVTPAQLGIVTFRPDVPGLPAETMGRIARDIAEGTLDDGHALVLTTDLGAGPVLRLCITSPDTQVADIASTVELLDALLMRRVFESGPA
jgi:aromatic-L-amino-acid/L-tryptophan decarboxylase